MSVAIKDKLPLVLKEEMRKGAYKYKLVQRGAKSCIYSKSFSSSFRCFEVFQIKTRPERIVKDSFLPAQERFPNHEDFGEWAWTYRCFENALAKFKLLEDER